MIKKLRSGIYRLLRFSERYTKTDMVYLGSGGIWLGILQVVAVFMGLILSIAYAHFLPKDSFGVYKYILSFVSVVTAFSLTGMDTAIIQAISRGFEGALKQGFRTYIRWSGGSIAILIAGACYYIFYHEYTIAISLLIATALSPLLNGWQMYSPFLQGKKDFKRLAKYGVLLNTVPALIIIGTIYITNNPIMIVLAFFSSNTIMAALFYYRVLRLYKPNNMTDSQTAAYSKHLSFINLLGVTANNLDTILIFHFLGAAPTAIYSFAYAPVKQLRNITKILGNLILPKYGTRTIPELKQTILGKTVRFSIVMSAIMIVYIILAPYFYRLLFPQYLDSVLYSQALALLLIFGALGIFFGQALTAHMKTRELYISNVTTSVMRIVLFFILLPSYGIWGVIAALLIARIISTISLAVLFVRL